MLFMGASNPNQFFCSQLVADAYKQAGLELTYADPRWLSPADLLHMREGDVPAFSPKKKLEYLGHLKLDVPHLMRTGKNEALSF